MFLFLESINIHEETYKYKNMNELLSSPEYDYCSPNFIQEVSQFHEWIRLQMIFVN